MVVLESGSGRMEISGEPEPRIVKTEDGTNCYLQDSTAGIVSTVVDIRGFEEIHWPNREGEVFSPKNANRVLSNLGRANNGLSLCWPATASMQGLGVSNSDGFHVLSAEPDHEGLIRYLTLESPESDHIRMIFTGTAVEWRLASYPAKQNYAKKSSSLNTLWQIGLIDPDGVSRVPEGQGFSILEEAAKRIVAVSGPPRAGDIIHMFGYAAGHDRGYPDYSPSKALGGPAALTQAVSALERAGFLTSLYMNARLAEKSEIERNSELISAAMTDRNGNPVVEKYHGRDFLVMNPESSIWRERLLHEAEALAATGARWLQLDQVAGRAAPSEAAAPWGAGYRRLIEDIQSLGINVWIQGVSDYYPADAFEATWREIDILEDGTLRGGCPFGSSDTTLLEACGFKGKLIVPASKLEDLGSTSLGFIRDGNAVADVLPLWDSDWPGSHISANNSRLAGENNGGSK